MNDAIALRSVCVFMLFQLSSQQSDYNSSTTPNMEEASSTTHDAHPTVQVQNITTEDGTTMFSSTTEETSKKHYFAVKVFEKLVYCILLVAVVVILITVLDLSRRVKFIHRVFKVIDTRHIEDSHRGKSTARTQRNNGDKNNSDSPQEAGAAGRERNDYEEISECDTDSAGMMFCLPEQTRGQTFMRRWGDARGFDTAGHHGADVRDSAESTFINLSGCGQRAVHSEAYNRLGFDSQQDLTDTRLKVRMSTLDPDRDSIGNDSYNRLIFGRRSHHHSGALPPAFVPTVTAEDGACRDGYRPVSCVDPQSEVRGIPQTAVDGAAPVMQWGTSPQAPEAPTALNATLVGFRNEKTTEVYTDCKSSGNGLTKLGIHGNAVGFVDTLDTPPKEIQVSETSRVKPERGVKTPASFGQECENWLDPVIATDETYSLARPCLPQTAGESSTTHVQVVQPTGGSRDRRLARPPTYPVLSGTGTGTAPRKVLGTTLTRSAGSTGTLGAEIGGSSHRSGHPVDSLTLAEERDAFLAFFFRNQNRETVRPGRGAGTWSNYGEYEDVP